MRAFTRSHPLSPSSPAPTLAAAVQAWGVPPHQLLMVGDSSDDIEAACAAGTASCLIAGGGSETSADAVAPPMLGGVATFTVDSLPHLQQRLVARDTQLGWGARSSTSSGSSCSDDDSGSGPSALSMAGAPPAGLDFLDALFALGVVQVGPPRVQHCPCLPPTARCTPPGVCLSSPSASSGPEAEPPSWGVRVGWL